jgi:hypothetical protein
MSVDVTLARGSVAQARRVCATATQMTPAAWRSLRSAPRLASSDRAAMPTYRTRPALTP